MLSVREGRNRRQRGASLVELSLVLIILVLLLAGVIDFGRAFNSYIVINNAAREGAREGSLRSHRADLIERAVEREVQDTSVSFEDLRITIDPDPDDVPAPPGQPIVVTVEYDVPTILTNLVRVDFLTLRARTEMVVFDDGP